MPQPPKAEIQKSDVFVRVCTIESGPKEWKEDHPVSWTRRKLLKCYLSGRIILEKQTNQVVTFILQKDLLNCELGQIHAKFTTNVLSPIC